MTLEELLGRLVFCLRTAAAHVEAVQRNCFLIANPAKRLHSGTFQKTANSIRRSLGGLIRLLAELDAVPPEIWCELADGDFLYKLFLWREEGYQPGALAVEHVLRNLIDETPEVEFWKDWDAEQIVNDCTRTLAQWPGGTAGQLRELAHWIEYESLRIPTPPTSENQTAEAATPVEPDGPIPPNRFRCNGREFCLPHKTWRIVNDAWTSENRSLTFVDAEELHGDSITKGVAKRIRRNFNKAAAGSGISMSLAAECFTIEFQEK